MLFYNPSQWGCSMYLECIPWLEAPVKKSRGVQFFLPQPSAQPHGLAILKVGFQNGVVILFQVFFFFQPVMLKIDGGV